MIGALLTIGASLVGVWLWWLKNRAKTRQQIDDDQIEYARKLQDSYDKEYSILSSIRPLELKELPPPMQTKTKIQKFFEPQKKIKLQEPDKDFEYAKKLQAAYDRENSLLSSFKRGLGKKK